MNKRFTTLISKVLVNHRVATCAGGCLLIVAMLPSNVSATAVTIHSSAAYDSRYADILIKGTVKDEKGGSIPGASVKVKGSNIATITDGSGNFTLTVPEKSTLQISYLGYVTKEVVVTSQAAIDISLAPSTSELSEVVVVGYGTQKKVSLTNSVSSVTSSEIITTKNENVQNMLTGKVSGLRVVQNSAEPGSFDNSFDIRGLGSPLVIIDGVPRENITRLDPNDIESISVLKDAGAAVYGVRAANGVVLVTTKKGRKGSVELNYSGNQTWQVPVGLPKSIDALGYMTLVNEKLLHNSNGGTVAYTEADFEAYRNGTKTSTDWYSPVIRDVFPQSQHNLSASGGGENTTYFLSLGYASQKGFLKSGDLEYKRYNVRSNISSQVTKNLTVDLNINGILDNKQQPYDDSWWIIRSFWRQNPLDNIYANNNPAYLFHPSVDGTNPVSLSQRAVTGYKDLTNRWFQSSISLTYDVPFIKGLKAKGMYSYDYNTADNKIYQQQYSQYTYDAATDAYTPRVLQSPSKLTREYFSRPNTLSQLSLNYDRTFGESHNLSALLLYENSERNSDNFYASRELALAVDQLLAGNSLNQIGNMRSGDLYKNANSGLVGRINYNYKTKYLAEVSFRNDVSSKFPVNHQSGFFPSVSAGWRLSEEDFWKNSSALNKINSFKLRGSYGKLGDDNASSYQFITGYTYPAGGDANRLPPGSVFNGVFVNSVESKGLANPDIFWYVAKTLDVGFDLEAWNGLFGMTASIFKRDRTGLISRRNLSLPSVVGATLPEENLNSDRTQGFDLELSHKNTIGEFNYFVRGVFSYTRTKNVYIERASSGNSYENWRNNSNNRFNDARWGYGAAGQFQSFNDLINSPVFVSRNTIVGDYAYEDWNGDGVISSYDVHPIAFNGIPRINYGLTIGGSFKGFDANLLFQGTGIVNTSYVEQLREPLWGGGSGLEQFLDRYHTLDPNADPYDPNTQWVPGHFANTGTLPDENSNYNIQDASYIRLKNVELGYTIPSNFASKIGIKGARIFVNGYNIFTITDLKFVDPEHPSSSYGYLYPLNKTYSVGLNVKF